MGRGERQENSRAGENSVREEANLTRGASLVRRGGSRLMFLGNSPARVEHGTSKERPKRDDGDPAKFHGRSIRWGTCGRGKGEQLTCRGGIHNLGDRRRFTTPFPSVSSEDRPSVPLPSPKSAALAKVSAWRERGVCGN